MIDVLSCGYCIGKVGVSKGAGHDLCVDRVLSVLSSLIYGWCLASLLLWCCIVLLDRLVLIVRLLTVDITVLAVHITNVVFILEGLLSD